MQDSDKENPVQREIDRNLKRIFDETAEQPLPPQLAGLVERLRQKEKSSSEVSK